MPLGTVTQTNYQLARIPDCYIRVSNFLGNVPILNESKIPGQPFRIG